MSHQPHPRGEPHPHPSPHRGHGCHVLPSGLPRASRRTSWRGRRVFLLPPPCSSVSGPPWGRYWAISHKNRPIPARRPQARILSVIRAIAVPLLTVVSQSGEQTPPPAHAGLPSALCLKTVRPTCAKQESACSGEHSDISQTMPLCEEAVTYGAAVAFSQLGRILICPRGRSCQQPMSCSCASLVPIVCPASPHMRKGMACVIRHHDVKKWVPSWLDITSGVSNRTNRFRPTSPRMGICGRRICPADVDRFPCNVSAP